MGNGAPLLRAARGQGAIELALGETLSKLFEGDRLLALGYARQADYARERLGACMRSVHAWTALARGLASRSLLRKAVVAGRVTPSKARAVMDAATGDREAQWVSAAISMGLEELKRCVAAGGFDAAADCFEVESLMLSMTAEQQDRLDAALELAKEVVGPATPLWMRLEAICQEWLGEFAGHDPELKWERPMRLEVRPGLERLLGQATDDRLPDSATELDERARELMRTRVARDEELGRLLLELLESRAYEGTFNRYVSERLGMSPRNAWNRIWLEKQLRGLPSLREALKVGRITLSKAQLIARRATPYTVDGLITEAETTTWQQLEHDSTAEEDVQNRADGKRRIWGPTDAFETILHAIRVASYLDRGYYFDQGEGLAKIADHFVSIWKEHRRKVPPARREVLGRHGGRCGVPGCSAPAAHVHHIIYRSRGGLRETSNEVALCVAHHLRGVHDGLLHVVGIGGEKLCWRFGDERWVTRGDDDVRKEVPEPP